MTVVTVRVATVVPDVTGLDKQFDYLVPPELDAQRPRGHAGAGRSCTVVGSAAGSRRSRIAPTDGRPLEALKPILKVTGHGPAPELFDLAEWASVRWAARRIRPFLVMASPRPSRGQPAAGPAHGDDAGAARRLRPDSCWPTAVECCVCRPRADVMPTILAAVACGPTLVVMPEHDLGRRWWPRGFDEPDCRSPWCPTTGPHAAGRRRRRDRIPLRRVGAVSRSRRRCRDRRTRRGAAGGAHADVARPRRPRRAMPSCWGSLRPGVADTDARRSGRVRGRTAWCTLRPRGSERGWPRIVVVDRTDEDPWKRSLVTSELIERLRDPALTVVCVSNITGRARVLACRSCRALDALRAV